MKTISAKQLPKLRKNKKVDRKQASEALRELHTRPEPEAVDKLVISVSEAVQGANEMNRGALDLIRSMFSKLTMTQPIIPAPRIYMPDPPKRWRFTVKRDSDGLIAEVVAERLDEGMPGEM